MTKSLQGKLYLDSGIQAIRIKIGLRVRAEEFLKLV